MGRLRKRIVTTLAWVMAFLLFPAAGRAGTFVAFGPAIYQRGTGSPVTVESAFGILNPFTSYTLQIYNGGLQDGDFEKVSSSVIALNGANVVGPQEFNQNVSFVEKPVSPSSANTLSGVDPLSWTPDPLGEGGSRWPRPTVPIPRSSAAA